MSDEESEHEEAEEIENETKSGRWPLIERRSLTLSIAENEGEEEEKSDRGEEEAQEEVHVLRPRSFTSSATLS